jgi:hypothetical protein
MREHAVIFKDRFRGSGLWQDYAWMIVQNEGEKRPNEFRPAGRSDQARLEETA